MEAQLAELDVSPTILDFPNEILLKIFEFLPQSAHCAVGLVSKRFQELIDNTKWWDVNTSVLEISEDNVLVLKMAIEMKNKKLCFNRVKIYEVQNIEALEYILKSIGKQIENLWMIRTAAFHLLKNSVINLKSLKINFDSVLEDNIDDESFNLCFFPLLEELSFMYNFGKDVTTTKLLKQLKSPETTSSLKHIKLYCTKETENYVIDSLLRHVSTLESLELNSFPNCVDNLQNWENIFFRMKNLKKLCLNGDFTKEMLNVILKMLPNETLLKHLVLTPLRSIDNTEIFPLILKKWITSLQFLELSDFSELTDDDAMELGKLHQLRVLKLKRSENITKMGFLAGIAKEKNIFMDELHLSGIWKLDESGLRGIVSRFPNLRVLTLNYCEEAITNTFLASIFRFSTRLRSLYINDCSNITDEGMIGFGNNAYSINRLRLLVNLKLVSCRYLTDRTLIEAFKFPALQSLELWYSPKFTLKGIESLMKSCPLLEFLSIPCNIILTDNCLSENALFVIGNGFKRLRQLKITSCYDLTEKDLDRIREVFIALRNSTPIATFSPDCKLKFQ